MKTVIWKLLLFGALLEVVPAEPIDLGPSSILDGISNAASSATNYISGVVKRQQELLHQVTDTATDYVARSVEKPRNMLMNAKRLTADYIDSAASKGLEFKLRAVVEKFRDRMPYGFHDIGIPVMEPLRIPHFDFETHNKEIGDIRGYIDNVTVHHLSTFEIDHARLSLSGPTISLNLSVPMIYATGSYNISGMLGDMVSLHGTGPFEATIYDATCYINTILGYSRGMYMKTFDLDFSIKSIDMNLHNFMGDDEFAKVLNKVFAELTPEALEIIKPELLPKIQDYIAYRANETIYHLTTIDVINFLTGKLDIHDFAHLITPGQ